MKNYKSKTHININKLFATSGLFIPKQSGIKSIIKNFYTDNKEYYLNYVNLENDILISDNIDYLKYEGKSLNTSHEILFYALIQYRRYMEFEDQLSIELTFKELFEIAKWNNKLSFNTAKRNQAIDLLFDLKDANIKVKYNKKLVSVNLLKDVEVDFEDGIIKIEFDKKIDDLLEIPYRSALNFEEYQLIKNEYAKCLYKLIKFNEGFKKINIYHILQALNLNIKKFNEDKAYRKEKNNKIKEAFEYLINLNLLKSFSINRNKNQSIKDFSIVRIKKEVKEEVKEENSLLNILKEQNINIDTLKIDNKKIKRENRLLKDIFEYDICKDD